MGDRYQWDTKCQKCGATIEVYYAPSCEMTTVKCWGCGTVFDIEQSFHLVESSGDKASGAAVEYKLRPEVAAFAMLMEAELRKHDDRPGWKHCNLDWLLGRLREETGELSDAVFIRGQHTAEEAADVANFAMMIADVSGGLKPAPSPAPTIKQDLTVGPPKKMSPEATKKILRQIESRDDYSNICPTPTIITPVDGYFFARVGDRAALYEKLPDNKPGKLVCEIPPCPAPLPKEVEGMIHTLDLLADDWYASSGEYGESPNPEANESMKPHVEAIRAVIKASLRPMVVTRKWIRKRADWAGCLGVTDVAGILRELGIEVEETP